MGDVNILLLLFIPAQAPRLRPREAGARPQRLRQDSAKAGRGGHRKGEMRPKPEEIFLLRQYTDNKSTDCHYKKGFFKSMSRNSRLYRTALRNQCPFP